MFYFNELFFVTLFLSFSFCKWSCQFLINFWILCESSEDFKVKHSQIIFEDFEFVKQRSQMDFEKELKNWKSKSFHLNFREVNFFEVLQVHIVSSKYVLNYHIRRFINLFKFFRFRRIFFVDIIDDFIESLVMSLFYLAFENDDDNFLLRDQLKHQTWIVHHRFEIITTQKQLKETSVTLITPQVFAFTFQKNNCSNATNRVSFAFWFERIHQFCELLNKNKSYSIWRESKIFIAFDL